MVVENGRRRKWQCQSSMHKLTRYTYAFGY